MVWDTVEAGVTRAPMQRKRAGNPFILQVTHGDAITALGGSPGRGVRRTHQRWLGDPFSSNLFLSVDNFLKAAALNAIRVAELAAG